MLSFLSSSVLVLSAFTSAISASETSLSATSATDAVVVGHLFPACNGRGKRRSLNVPVDRCLSTPTLALEIKTAAICSNGTRALWARFPAKGCGNGELDPKFGLVELPESEMKCLDVMGIESMAFWCDGVQPKSDDDDEREKEPEKEVDKSRKGSVSESACMVAKAPFWKHTSADTCVDLRTDKMQVTNAAICANGTTSTLALYKGPGCHGAPAIQTIQEQKGRECLNVETMGSYAFYCSGNGIERGHAPSSNPRSGGFLHFLLILTLIIMMSVLALVLSIYTWVRKYGGSAGKIIETVKNLFKPREGEIAI